MGKIDYTKDLEGKQFGYLKVLHMDTERTRQGKRKWICKCLACGKIVSIPRTQLINGDAKSCGCKQYEPKEKNKINLIGKKIGYLKVLEKVSGNGVSTIWKCQCERCGNITNIVQSALLSGRVKSCGCYGRDRASREIKENMGLKDGTNVSKLKSNKLFLTNTTGIRGVSYNKAYGKYYSYIGFKGKLYGLGFYAKKEEAEEVRKRAEKELYGTFLDWYAENFPEQWKRMQKKNSSGE